MKGFDVLLWVAGVAVLATDRRAVAPHGAGDLGLTEPLPSESGEHIPLLRGELAVRHGYDLFVVVEVLAGIAAPPLFREACCT